MSPFPTRRPDLQQQDAAVAEMNRQAAEQDFIAQQQKDNARMQQMQEEAARDAARAQKAALANAKRQGVKIAPDATGAETIQRHPDGQPVYEAGFVGEPQINDKGGAVAYRDARGQRYDVPFDAIRSEPDPTGETFYSFDVTGPDGQKQTMRQPAGTKPLFRVDPGTGSRIVDVTDPATGSVQPRVVGVDPLVANKAAIEKRKNAAQLAQNERSGAAKMLQLELDQKEVVIQPVRDRLKEAQDAADKLAREKSTYEQTADGYYAVTSLGDGVEPMRRKVDSPQEIAKADAWVKNRTMTEKALAEAKAAHDPAAAEIQAMKERRAALAIETLKEDNRAQAEIQRMQEAAEKGTDVTQADWQTRVQSLANDERMRKLNTIADLEAAGDPLAGDVQRAAMPEAAASINRMMSGMLNNGLDLLNAGLGAGGKSTLERAIAESPTMTQQNGKPATTDEARRIAAKSLGITDPARVEVTPNPLGHLELRYGNDEFASYEPDRNRITIMQTAGGLHERAADLIAKADKDGVPVYLSNTYPNKAEQPFTAAELRDLLVQGVDAVRSADSQDTAESALSQVGLAPNDIRGMVRSGKLSVQDGRMMLDKFHGVEAVNYSRPAIEQELGRVLATSKTAKADWEAGNKAAVINRVMDGVASKATSGVVVDRGILEQRRQELLAQHVKEGAASKVGGFFKELIMPMIGIGGQAVAYVPQKLAKWTGYETEAGRLSEQQFEDWLKRTGSFVHKMMSRDDVIGSLMELRSWAKTANPGDSPPDDLAEKIAGIAYDGYHELTDDAAKALNTSRDTFNVNRDPMLRAALDRYLRTADPAAFDQLSSLLMMDAQDRKIQAEVSAYISAPRVASAGDVIGRAKGLNIDLTPDAAGKLIGISRVLNRTEDQKAAQHLITEAGKIMGLPPEEAAATLARVTADETDDPDSAWGLLKGGYVAGRQELATEALSTGMEAGLAWVTAGAATPEIIAERAARQGIKTGIRAAIRRNAQAAFTKLADSSTAFAKTSALLGTARRTVGTGLANMGEAFAKAGIKTPTFGSPLSRMSRIRNGAAQVGKVAAVAAPIEMMEEFVAAIGEPAPSEESVAHQMMMGFAGGMILSPIFMGVSAIGQAWKNRGAGAEWEARKTGYIDELNRRMESVPGFKPLTVADFDAWQGLQDNPAQVQARQSMIDAFNRFESTVKDGSATDAAPDINGFGVAPTEEQVAMLVPDLFDPGLSTGSRSTSPDIEAKKTAVTRRVEELFGFQNGYLTPLRWNVSKVFKTTDGKYIKIASTNSVEDMQRIQAQLELLRDSPHAVATELKVLHSAGIFALMQKEAGIEGASLAKELEASDKMLFEQLKEQNPLSAELNNGALRVETDGSLKNMALYVQDGMVRTRAFDFDGIADGTTPAEIDAARTILANTSLMPGIPLTAFSQNIQNKIVAQSPLANQPFITQKANLLPVAVLAAQAEIDRAAKELELATSSAFMAMDELRGIPEAERPLYTAAAKAATGARDFTEAEAKALMAQGGNNAVVFQQAQVMPADVAGPPAQRGIAAPAVSNVAPGVYRLPAGVRVDVPPALLDSLVQKAPTMVDLLRQPANQTPAVQAVVAKTDAKKQAAPKVGKTAPATPAETQASAELSAQAPAMKALPKVAKKRSKLLATLKAKGVVVRVVNTTAEAEAILGKRVAKGRKGVAQTVNGVPHVVLIGEQAENAMADTLDHEAIHGLSLAFAAENPELHAAAMLAVDPASPEFDAALDEFMRREYNGYDKLSQRQKFEESLRAIVEGRWKGRTSAKSKGFKKFLKAFLAYVRSLMDGSQNAALKQIVANIELALKDSQTNTSTDAGSANQTQNAVQPGQSGGTVTKPGTTNAHNPPVGGTNAQVGTGQQNDSSRALTDLLNRPSAEIIDALSALPTYEARLEWLAQNGFLQPVDLGGKARPMVDYADRKIVLMRIGGVAVPFYQSTGHAGKKNVKAMRWYPVFGIHPESGWINKGTEAQINAYYNQPILAKLAKILDEGVGAIPLDDAPYGYLTDEVTDLQSFNSQTNISGLKPSDVNSYDAFMDNAIRVVHAINGEIQRHQQAQAGGGAVVTTGQREPVTPSIETPIDNAPAPLPQDLDAKLAALTKGVSVSFTKAEKATVNAAWGEASPFNVPEAFKKGLNTEGKPAFDTDKGKAVSLPMRERFDDDTPVAKEEVLFIVEAIAEAEMQRRNTLAKRRLVVIGGHIANDGGAGYFWDTDTVAVNPQRLARMVWAEMLNAGKAPTRRLVAEQARGVITHEIVHAAQFEAARLAYSKIKGDKPAFEEWVKGYYEAIWNSLDPEQQQATIAAYGTILANAPEWHRGAEASRMLLETGTMERMSEAIIRHLENVLAVLKRWYDDVVNGKADNAIVADEIERVQAVLDAWNSGGTVKPDAKKKPAKPKAQKPEAPKTPKSSTQLTLSPADAKPILDFGATIPKDELFDSIDPEWSDGALETEPHVTVLYGLTKHEAAPVAKVIKDHGPITITLGKLSIFENDQYDVLKVDVESPELRALNAKLSKLPHESSFPDYKPHMTIAYLKKGEGKKYVGDARFEGRTITFNTMTFSPPSELRGKLGKPELPLTPSQAIPPATTQTADVQDQTEAQGQRQGQAQEVLTPASPETAPRESELSNPDMGSAGAVDGFSLGDGVMWRGAPYVVVSTEQAPDLIQIESTEGSSYPVRPSELQRYDAPQEANESLAVQVPEEGRLSVYPLRDRWLVQQSETRGFGDHIYDTEQEAIQAAIQQQNMEAENRRFQAEQERRQQEQAAEAARVAATLTTYLDSLALNAMQRGKLKSALETDVARQSSAKNKTYSGPRFLVAEEMVADGYRPQTEQVPAIKEPTRTQWNRMDNRQQAEFERRRKEAGTKTEYTLALPDGSAFVVTKAEHDYANWLSSRPPSAEGVPGPSSEQGAAPATPNYLQGFDQNQLNTPLMQQWRALRDPLADNPNTILLVRLGDFYEAFGGDATELARILEIALTKRNGVPMSGIPHHSAEGYIQKLVRAGKRVAVAEMMEGETQAVKGKREIVRVEPAPAASSELQQAKEANIPTKEVTTPEPVKEKKPADNKALKEMKRFLLEKLDDAIAEAPDGRITPSAYSGRVVIEIPGDGTFTLVNEKKVLQEFAKRAKSFPTSTPSATYPKPTAIRPSSIPALNKAKLSKMDMVKVAGTFASTDETRMNIMQVVDVGDTLVATNGKYLFMAPFEGQGTAEDPMLYTAKGGQIGPQSKHEEDFGKYPDWKVVVPKDTQVLHTGIDTGRLWQILKQASAVFRDVNFQVKNGSGTFDDAAPYVDLLLNPDGSVAVVGEVSNDSGAASNLDRYEHNLQEGAQSIGRFDASLFMDILAAMRALGQEKVSFRSEADMNQGAFVVSSPVADVILMRVRTQAATTAANVEAAQEAMTPAEQAAAAPVDWPTESRNLTLADTARAAEMTEAEIEAAATPVLEALRELEAPSGVDQAGIAKRGGSVYDEALEGKFSIKELAAAHVWLRRHNAYSVLMDSMEYAIGRDSSNDAPAAPKASGLRTQADTIHAGRSPAELLALAAPYEQQGPDYNRNIAESAARLRQSVERGDKSVQYNADELAVRLEKWAPEASLNRIDQEEGRSLSSAPAPTMPRDRAEAIVRNLTPKEQAGKLNPKERAALEEARRSLEAPLASAPVRSTASGMASASGAAQANEPSPGGLSEAEVTQLQEDYREIREKDKQKTGFWMSGPYWHVTNYTYSADSSYVTYRNVLGVEHQFRISNHEKPPGHSTDRYFRLQFVGDNNAQFRSEARKWISAKVKAAADLNLATMQDVVRQWHVEQVSNAEYALERVRERAAAVTNRVAELEDRLARKKEAYAQGIRIGNGKPFTTENQREQALAGIAQTENDLTSEREASKSKIDSVKQEVMKAEQALQSALVAQQKSQSRMESGSDMPGRGPTNLATSKTGQSESSLFTSEVNPESSRAAGGTQETFSLRVTPAQDAEYMAAVEAGDMAKAQRMADEAANDADLEEWFHGNTKSFGGFSSTDLGVHLGTEESAQDRLDQTGQTSGVVSRYYVDIKNPVKLQYDPDTWQALDVWSALPKDIKNKVEDSYQYVIQDLELGELKTELKKLGFDGIKYPNAFEGIGDSILVFEDSQIKSADPVVYANGNVIPLSQRFNPQSDSILYSAPVSQSQRQPQITAQNAWALMLAPSAKSGIATDYIDGLKVALANANTLAADRAVSPAIRQKARQDAEQLQTLIPEEEAAWQRIRQQYTPQQLKQIHDDATAYTVPVAELQADLDNLLADFPDAATRPAWATAQIESLQSEISGGTLASSPIRKPNRATQAMRDIIEALPPPHREVLRDLLVNGMTPEDAATKHKLSETAVGHILRRGEAHIRLMLDRAPTKPTVQVQDGIVKATDGRPDLAMSGNAAVAAVDQRRMTPEEVTHAEMQELATRLFDVAPAEAESLVVRWMDSGTTVLSTDGMPDSIKAIVAEAQARNAAEMMMTAAAKMLVARKTLEGGNSTQLARLIYLYRNTGTEQARALGMRRDPFDTPEERAAMYLSEALLTPPDAIKNELRRNPANRDRILAAWAKRADEIKAEMLAHGIDLDATFADHAEEQKLVEETIPEPVKPALARAPKKTRQIVKAIMQGLTPAEAIRAAGLTAKAAFRAYQEFRASLNQAGTEAAQAMRDQLLRSAPVQGADFAANLGLPDLTEAEWLEAVQNNKPLRKTPETEKLKQHREKAKKAGTLDLKNSNSTRKAKRAIQERKSTTFDKWSEFWRASILSGPQTHVVNIVSGLTYGTYEASFKKLAAGAQADIARMFGAKPDAASLADVPAMIAAVLPSIREAFTNSIASWKSETSAFDSYAMQLQDDNGELFKEDYKPALKGTLGKVMRGISFRLMGAADEFVKSFFTRIEVAAQARQIARNEGKTGLELARTIQELMEPGSLAWERALAQAKRITFQNEEVRTENGSLKLESPLTAGDRAIDAIDGLAQLISRTKKGDFGKPLKGLAHFTFPFVDTPTNIFKAGVTMSPVGGLLALVDMIRAYNRYRKGNAEEAAKIYNAARALDDLTNQIVAWGFILGLSHLVKPGDDEDETPFITGTIPWRSTSPGERELAYRTAPPQSIRIGDRWISYKRLDPFASALAFTVDAIKEFQSGKPIDEVGTKIGLGIMRNMQDKTFLQGISDVVNAVQDPERFGTKWATNIATGFIPNLIRQPIRTADDVFRETDLPNDLGFWDALGRRMGYSIYPQGAMPSITVWGEPARKDTGTGGPNTDWLLRLLSPADMRAANVDMLDVALLRYNATHQDGDPRALFGVTAPSRELQRTIGGQVIKISLDDAEHEDFLTKAGKAARQAIGNTYEGRDLTEQDVERIKDIISRAQGVYRDAAFVQAVQKRGGLNALANTSK